MLATSERIDGCYGSFAVACQGNRIYHIIIQFEMYGLGFAAYYCLHGVGSFSEACHGLINFVTCVQGNGIIIFTIP